MWYQLMSNKVGMHTRNPVANTENSNKEWELAVQAMRQSEIMSLQTMWKKAKQNQELMAWRESKTSEVVYPKTTTNYHIKCK